MGLKQADGPVNTHTHTHAHKMWHVDKSGRLSGILRYYIPR